MRVDILAKFNQYESKRYFARKLAEAFKRKLVDVNFLESDTGSYIEQWSKKAQPMDGFACSFNRLQPFADGTYLWEKLPFPFISLLIDPAIYNLEAFTTPRSFATCVDRDDYTLASSYGNENVRFMPHAIESELARQTQRKHYPIVFIGSCYDPDHLKAYWQKNLAPIYQKIIEEAIEASFNDLHVNFLQATKDSILKNGLTVDQVPFEQLYYFVDYYMRGYDRLELIRSITDVEIHVFGGTCWRKERPIVGWNHYLQQQRNVIIHPAVNYQESLEILKQSKLCLHSVPTLRNGSHERVLAAYACECLPVSSDNLFWREEFGDDIVLYPYQHRQVVTEKIKELLKNDFLRDQMIQRGREKVMQKHTWDHRADMLIQLHKEGWK